MLIITFHPNDLENAGNPEQYGYPKPLFILVNGSLVLTNTPVPQKKVWDNRNFLFFQKINFFFSYYSHSWIFFKNNIKTLISKYKNKKINRTADEFYIYAHTYTGDYAIYGALQKALYEKIALISKDKNITTLILYIPSKDSLSPATFFETIETAKLNHSQYDISKPKKVIQEIAIENNISLVDPSSLFENKTYYYFNSDPHWTKEGHAAVADILYKHLTHNS